MNLWFHEEMTLVYICMLELIKEDFNQVLGTSISYKKVRMCNFWYFVHHDMMNDEDIDYKVM